MGNWPQSISGGTEPKESKKTTWSLVFGALGFVVGMISVMFTIYAQPFMNENSSKEMNNGNQSVGQQQIKSASQLSKQKQIELYNCIAAVDEQWATYIESVKNTPQASQYWNGITPAQQAAINNCN